MQSQKWALYAATKAVKLNAYKYRGYSILHPWSDIDGPKTETGGRYDYSTARSICANYCAYWAMIAMGYDKETACWATNETIWRGNAKTQLSLACKLAGPVNPKILDSDMVDAA